MSVHVRRVRVEDARQVAHLVTEMGFPSTVEEMKKRIQRVINLSSHATFVAELEGHLAGMIGVYLIYPYDCHRLKLRVAILMEDPGLAGKGISLRLLERAERWALENDADWGY